MQRKFAPPPLPSGDPAAAAAPLDRRRFVSGAAGLAALALLGGCAASGDGNYCYETTRIGVKGRRIKAVPCPEDEE